MFYGNARWLPCLCGFYRSYLRIVFLGHAIMKHSTGMKQQGQRRFWTLGRRLVAGFSAAILLGFALMVGLQALDLQKSLIGLSVTALKEKTTQLGNAMRVGIMGGDGGALESEYKPLADAPESQLAAIAAYRADGSEIIAYHHQKLPHIEIAGRLSGAPDVLAKGEIRVETLASHVVIIVPVQNLRGNKVIGAIVAAWSIEAQNAAIRTALERQVLVAVIVMVVLLLVLFMLVQRLIAGPLMGMSAAMETLASGEVSIAIPGLGRGDEIGRMAASVAIFRDNAQAVLDHARMREVEKQAAEEARRSALLDLAGRLEASVKSVADSLGRSAGALEDGARNLAQSAVESSGRIAGAASASTETSASIESVAAAAEELSASIAELDRQSKGSAKVAELAVREATQASRRVGELSSAASRIGEVVRLINDIASRTNLLALNATIEAARAGDAGKGFAVVAGEVKALATQTARATDDIAEQVAAIQGATQEVATVIQGIEATIHKISEISASMTEGIGQQGHATAEIARSVQQASGGAAEVSDTITRVSQLASETGRSADAILGSAQSLVGQSETLTHALQDFLAAARAA